MEIEHEVHLCPPPTNPSTEYNLAAKIVTWEIVGGNSHSSVPQTVFLFGKVEWTQGQDFVGFYSQLHMMCK